MLQHGFGQTVLRYIANMRVEELIQLHKAAPFRPFRTHLADGRHLDAKHAEFLAYTPRGRIAIVMRMDATFEILDLMLVTSLEVTDGKPPYRRERE